MEAIRKIVTLEDRILQIDLPESHRDKTEELIIFATEEQTKATKPNVDYKSMYGSLGLTMEQIDEQLNTLRAEWTRDIS